MVVPVPRGADLDALGLPAGDVRRRAARVSNPLDAERPLLRTTLLPGLLDTVLRNLSRGARDLVVVRDRPGVPAPDRPAAASGASGSTGVRRTPSWPCSMPRCRTSRGTSPWCSTGEVDRSGWWGAGRTGGWADTIELARRIGRQCGAVIRVVPDDRMPWHPGRCASLRVGDWPVGTAGELHPAVVERLGLPTRTAALELNLDGIPEAGRHTAATVSPFPPVLLDVALVVDAGGPGRGRQRGADRRRR